MVAPTSTATPPPPPSESTATSDRQPPPSPPPSSAAVPDAASKKRKLQETGFQHSPYYNIRATVANLHGRFLQFCQGTDTQKKDAALEILKEIKVPIELSKKMQLELSAAAGPRTDEPAAGDARNMPAEKIPSGEKNQVPRTGQAASCMHSTGEKVPLNPVISEISAKRPSVEIKREGEPSVIDYTKMPGQRLQGSYVVGGSPIGWNFLMWPGSRAVYYGLTRSEWSARQSGK